MTHNRWLLPDDIADILPAQAAQVEGVRQRLLSHFNTWGYDQVIPPRIEFLESLLTGVSHDLQQLTCTLVDQPSGRQLGLPADTTQQIARIDAHALPRLGAARYCYCSPILHPQASSWQSHPSPIQIGAELFGVASIDSDIEIISLMLSGLYDIGCQSLTLDLGHQGVIDALLAQAQLDAAQQAQLWSLLSQRSVPDLLAWLDQHMADQPVRAQFAQLLNWVGDTQDLLRLDIPASMPRLQQAIDHVHVVMSALMQRFPQLVLHYDLAETRGYRYHTGLIFSVFSLQSACVLAQGGRYDDTGRAYGRARPATGFSADILALLTALAPARYHASILAPNQEDAALHEQIEQLRQRGERVVIQLTDEDCASTLYDRQLCCIDGRWQVRPLQERDAVQTTD